MEAERGREEKEGKRRQRGGKEAGREKEAKRGRGGEEKKEKKGDDSKDPLVRIGCIT